LKPENVVISLTNHELAEIKRNGCLTTTKMYDQKKKMIERSVAGTNKVLATSEPQDEHKSEVETVTENIGTEMSCCDTNLTRQDKIKNRKNKKKKVKKYIKSGKLPGNYHDLPQDEKDKLYAVVRSTIQSQNMKRDGIHISNSEDPTQNETNTNTNITNCEIDINY
jgi:hypothetical protein